MERIDKIVQKIINNPDKWLFYFLSTLLISSVFGILFIKSFFTLRSPSFWYEVAKTLLQIIPVSVIGTLVSILLSLFNSRRVELQKELDKLQTQKEKGKEHESALDNTKNQIKKDILHQLNIIYSDTKKTRRMLRAKALSIPYDHALFDNSNVYLIQYDRYMEEINDSQLKLEDLKKEIETYKGLFTIGRGEDIIGYIKKKWKSA